MDQFLEDRLETDVMDQFLDPETDIKNKFLDPETDIMGEWNSIVK